MQEEHNSGLKARNDKDNLDLNKEKVIENNKKN